MNTLEISEEERAELRSIVTTYLSDVRLEMMGTNSVDFREGLEQRETLLKGLLRRLGSASGDWTAPS
jgi:hypothetical protein